MIRRSLNAALAAMLAVLAHAAHAFECADMWDFIARPCEKSVAAWDHGRNELIFSGYAYHLRSTYTEDRLAELNEEAWGGGWARTVTDSDSDTHTIYAYAFRESHYKIQWNVGYLYSKWWGPQDGLRGSLGVTTLLVQRSDIFNGVPFPVILPVAQVGYKKLTLMSTFIPTLNNRVNNGSVLYFSGRYAF